jgi:hypothetical protein
MKPEDLREKIKKDLPNFPEEIIEDWILPFAKDLDWPPNVAEEQDRWHDILGRTPVLEWRKATWEFKQIELSKKILSPWGVKSFEEMKRAYLNKEENAYSGLRNSDGLRRFRSALVYVLEHGELPKPIFIRLVKDNDGYEIVDGNHRFLALEVSRGIFNELRGVDHDTAQGHRAWLTQTYKISSLVEPHPIQSVWVDTFPI